VTACSVGSSDTTQDVRVQLAWFTNAQNGGWTAAATEGYYQEAGLGAVTLQPGGPNVSPVQIVASGSADVGITSAESYIQARTQGIPITAVGSDFSTEPIGIMFKADTGWQTWADLAGKTWTVAPMNIGWQWVKKSTGIDFQTANYNGSIAAFLADPNGITQSYPTNELYTARKQGANVGFMSYSSSGYNPYGGVVFVRDDYLADHGDTLRAFLAAGFKGWVRYMSDVGVAARTNAAIVADNEQVTEDATWYAWDKQREYVIGDQAGRPIGHMDADRWGTFVDQLNQLGMIDQVINPAGLYTNDYLSADVVAPDPATLPAPPPGSYVGQS
jgi:NitT/TauT family transport system substrate-binding protein